MAGNEGGGGRGSAGSRNFRQVWEEEGGRGQKARTAHWTLSPGPQSWSHGPGDSTAFGMRFEPATRAQAPASSALPPAARWCRSWPGPGPGSPRTPTSRTRTREWSGSTGGCPPSSQTAPGCSSPPGPGSRRKGRSWGEGCGRGEGGEGGGWRSGAKLCPRVLPPRAPSHLANVGEHILP